MAVTAWKQPGTVVNSGTGTDFAANTGTLQEAVALAGDGKLAIATGLTASIGSSKLLLSTNFGFDSELPFNASIDGVEIRQVARKSAVDSPVTLTTRQLVYNGAGLGIAKAAQALTQTLTPYTVGGFGDKFGYNQLNATIVRSVLFGSWKRAANGSGVSQNVEIDVDEMRIHYSVPSESFVSKASAYLDRMAVRSAMGWVSLSDRSVLFTGVLRAVSAEQIRLRVKGDTGDGVLLPAEEFPFHVVDLNTLEISTASATDVELIITGVGA